MSRDNVVDIGLGSFDPAEAAMPTVRHVQLTPASDIPIRPVHWIWDGRLARGTLGLLAGPEGVGKSTLGYWLAARLTRGQLPGECHGEPRAVLVAATEDSWEHTIVPRLMAHGANLASVYRVDVITEDDLMVSLSMPKDLSRVGDSAVEVGAALMLLDPLMSRLDAKLDTHKDAEVRTALEPLVVVADRARLAILGLIHHNKSGSSDPLNLVMASKAFTAVARSVHTVIRDPEDESGERRLFGTSKNNLGRIDLPTLGYVIRGHHVGTTVEGEVWTGQLHWTGEVQGAIAEHMKRGQGTDEERSAVTDAADWLEDYLTMEGGSADSSDIKRDGGKAMHSLTTLQRARQRLGCHVTNVGMPRRTVWNLPEQDAPTTEVVTRAGGDSLYETTIHNGHKETGSPSGASRSNVSRPPRARGTTGDDSTDEDDLDPSDHEEEPMICPGCDLPIDPSITGGIHPACKPEGWR